MNYVDLLLRFEDIDGEDVVTSIESFIEDTFGIAVLDSLELVPENYYEIYFAEQLMMKGFNLNLNKLILAKELHANNMYYYSLFGEYEYIDYEDFIATLDKK